MATVLEAAERFFAARIRSNVATPPNGAPERADEGTYASRIKAMRSFWVRIEALTFAFAHRNKPSFVPIAVREAREQAKQTQRTYRCKDVHTVVRAELMFLDELLLHQPDCLRMISQASSGHDGETDLVHACDSSVPEVPRNTLEYHTGLTTARPRAWMRCQRRRTTAPSVSPDGHTTEGTVQRPQRAGATNSTRGCVPNPSLPMKRGVRAELIRTLMHALPRRWRGRASI